MYSKHKLNLRTTFNTLDKDRQIRALMPNLIHSLDSTCLNLLFHEFNQTFGSNQAVQFYSVHDCFGTTCDKVFNLKTMLAAVYTDLYSSEPYLYKFDMFVLDNIEQNTDFKVDRVKRKIYDPEGKVFTLHDIV